MFEELSISSKKNAPAEFVTQAAAKQQPQAARST